MPKYLGWLEQVLARNRKSGGQWLVGGRSHVRRSVGVPGRRGPALRVSERDGAARSRRSRWWSRCATASRSGRASPRTSPRSGASRSIRWVSSGTIPSWMRRRGGAASLRWGAPLRRRRRGSAGVSHPHHVRPGADGAAPSTASSTEGTYAADPDRPRRRDVHRRNHRPPTQRPRPDPDPVPTAVSDGLRRTAAGTSRPSPAPAPVARLEAGGAARHTALPRADSNAAPVVSSS